MKKTIFFTLIFFLINLSISAQNRNNSRVPEDRLELKDRLWYGTGFNLGFSSFNSVSRFLIGISPQVGYKINESFSAGPRASFQYLRESFNGQSDNVIIWTAGALSRYKLFWQIFGQIEYEHQRIVGVNNIFEENSSNNVYLGGGYNSSLGPREFGYEILLLYNLTEEPLSVDSRVQFRFGMTYNF